MKEPTEKEVAAAMERLHSSTEGLVLPKAGGPPWLTTMEVVDGIVREFMGEVIARYGTASQADFMGWLEAECLRMNELFSGYRANESRDDFQRSPWNMPQSIGVFVGMAMQIDCEARNAVRDAFMVTAASVIEILNADEGKPVEQWGWKLDAAREALRDALMGIPASDE